MTLSYYNPHDRYRQRSQQRLRGVMRVMFFAIIFGGCGFFIGRQYAKSENHILNGQITSLTQERDTLRTEVTDLRAQVQTANVRFQEVQNAYQQTVPAGPVEDLINLVHKQLDEGMDPARLEQLIKSGQAPRECTEPLTQRFVISTPAYTGPAGEIKIDEGAIIVKGSGISALNAEGKEEAWYNPAKPVAVEFVRSDGKSEKKEAMLPFSHAIILGEYEYRIKIEEGAKSFIKVISDRCEKSLSRPVSVKAKAG